MWNNESITKMILSRVGQNVLVKDSSFAIAKQELKKTSVLASYQCEFGFVEIEEGGNLQLRQIHLQFYLGIKSEIQLCLFYLQHFISIPLTNTMRILRRVKRDYLV